MENYNIVFATDQNYIQHLSVAIKSLLKNNENIDFNIYIINGGIEENKWIKLKSIVESDKNKLTNIQIDDSLFASLVTNHHFTKAMYYRLLIPKLISAEKVLYLDADIVVNGSIKDLYEIELNDYSVAAVLNPGFTRHEELKMDITASYFNSGVMLINNALWKKQNITQKIVDFVEKNKLNIKFPDQCGLNAIINGNWLQLPLKYNLQAVLFEDDFEKKYSCFDKVEVEEAKENPIIIHYTGSSKPWHMLNKHPYKALYWKYLRMTPFKRYFSEDISIKNILKLIIPQKMKNLIKNFTKR